MAIDLIDKIKPKNNGTFALVDAADVEMPDGSRLSAFATGSGGSNSAMETFDLVSLGMGVIKFDGSTTVFQTDTTEIQAALTKGAVKFIVNIMLGQNEATAEVVMNNLGADGMYICSAAFDFNGLPMIFTMYVIDGSIVAYITTLQTESVVTKIDLSSFDSAGKIIETLVDGSSRATFLEFDEDGNPVKITDSKGNVTTLTW